MEEIKDEIFFNPKNPRLPNTHNDEERSLRGES